MGVADLTVSSPAYLAAQQYLLRQCGATADPFARVGFQTSATTPGLRPYLAPAEPVFAAFQQGAAVRIATAPGYAGFARAWQHHVADAAAVCAPDNLRWLRQGLARAGARLHALAQYALLPEALQVPARATIRRLAPSDGPLLAHHLGWSVAQAAQALDHGVFASFVNGQLACHAVAWELDDETAEIGVRTTPEYRRRGLATATVLAAAHHLFTNHAAVLYTSELTDTRSRALAARVGAQHLGELLLAVVEAPPPPGPPTPTGHQPDRGRRPFSHLAGATANPPPWLAEDPPEPGS